MDELTNGYTGAVEDPRSDCEKRCDYTELDGLGKAVVVPIWEDKEWKTLSLRKQITSSSCGAQSAAKILESFNNLIASATPLYRFRANFSSEGMWLQNIGDVARNKKTTSETLSPSQNMTEVQMNGATIPDDRPYGVSGYYTLPIDMDLIATASEKGHGIIFGIGSNADEWQAVPVFKGNPVTFNHYVASIPKNYILHNGEKSFVIDDSCNAFSSIDLTGQRILTESFLKARCWGVLALIPDVPQPKPVHTFNVDLLYGQTGFDVKMLQEALIYFGFLKSGFNTGYYGQLTLNAVKAFQLAYKDEILTPAGITIPTGQFRKFSRQKMNSMLN